jgi:transposase-like protein
VNELIRALKDARDLVEALLKASGEPPQWLVDEANQELSAIDELVARLEGVRGRTSSLVSPAP